MAWLLREGMASMDDKTKWARTLRHAYEFQDVPMRGGAFLQAVVLDHLGPHRAPVTGR